MQENPAPQQPATPPEQLTPQERDARLWNMLCHLSALAIFVIPGIGNILGPLIVWQIKKNEIPSVEVHGKASLNFQITVSIAMLAGLVAFFALACIGIGFLFIALIPAIGLAGLVFTVIAGIKANDGKDYRYPWTLTLVK